MVNIRAITWGSQSLVHQPQQRSTALCWSGAVKLDIFGVVVSVLREYYHTVHQTRQIAGQIKICKKSQASSWGVQHNHRNSSHNRDQQWCTDLVCSAKLCILAVVSVGKGLLQYTEPNKLRSKQFLLNGQLFEQDQQTGSSLVSVAQTQQGRTQAHCRTINTFL